MCELFSYICRLELEGRAAELTEQEIGRRVFGRSASYNSADDSIVRSQARLLRQKLEEYFDHECPHTAEIILVPKGGYVPVFRPREVDPAPPAPPVVAVPAIASVDPPVSVSVSVAAPAAPVESGRRRWIVLLAILSGLAVLWWMLEHHPLFGKTSANLMWQSLFQRNQPTLIVASDDGLVLFQELTQSSVSLSDYLDGSYLREMRSNSSGLTFDPAWFADHQYTSVADLNLTLQLSRLPQAALAQVEVRDARNLRLEDLKTQNVILIGGPGSNPLVSLFADRLNFELGWDWTSREGLVRNKHPEPNEVPLYHDALRGSERKSYGLLAYVPGIDGSRRALLVEGTGMAGTEAAADFLFRPAFDDFVHTLSGPRGTMPFFEVLLETTSIGGNAPQARVVAYRRIQP